MRIRCACGDTRCAPTAEGRDRFVGGDGIVREIEVLTDCEVTLLADRRSRGPWGLSGGEDGAPGKTVHYAPRWLGRAHAREVQHPPAHRRENPD